MSTDSHSRLMPLREQQSDQVTIRDVGVVIADKRHELSWTLLDLAKVSGVSRWTIGRLEAGTAIASKDVAAALDRALGMRAHLVALGSSVRETRQSTAGASAPRQEHIATRDFGAVVTQKRAERGRTKQRLADEAHVARSTISRLEDGSKVPSEGIAAALDRALGMDGSLVALGEQTRVEPCSLPCAPLFVGRTTELARLDDLIGDFTEAMLPRGALIAGSRGVGKTALALRWANVVKGKLDHVLWSDLRGYSGGDKAVLRSPADVLEDLLRGLDVPPSRIPASEESRQALLRHRLRVRRHRTLIVLDNVRNLAQLKPALPGTPGTVELIGEDRVRAEPDAVERLVNLCAALPLALSIAGDRVAADATTSLQQHAAALAERGQMHLLEGDHGTSGVRAAFSWSCKALPPAGARMFRLLGLHPGPRFSVDAAAALAGITSAGAAAPLDQFAVAHFVRDIGGVFYSFYDLLRVYVTKEIAEPGWGEGREAALLRLVQWDLHGANAAAWSLSPTCDRHIRLVAPLEGVCPPRFDPVVNAAAWCAAEIDYVTPIMQLVYDSSMWFEAWRISVDIFEYF